MSLPRRSFLRDGLRAGVSIGIVLTGARFGFGQKAKRGQVRIPTLGRSEVPLEAQRDPVFLFTHATFDPYVGGIFQAPDALGQMVELTLLNVKQYVPTSKLTNRTRRSESFSLLFKAADRLPPFTSIHRINHPALGEFYLFLTPREGDNGDLLYEAVINHIR